MEQIKNPPEQIIIEDETDKVESQLVAVFSKIEETSVARYDFQGVSVLEDAKEIKAFGKKFNIPLTEKKILATYNGYVKIGVKDLSKKMTLDFNHETKTITANVPKAEIIENKLDSKMNYYDESHGLLTEFNGNDYSSIRLDAENQMLEKVNQDNYIENAQNELKNYVKSYIETIIVNTELKDYTITITTN